MQIWETFSFRQLHHFYRILIDRKVEEFKVNARLHGAEIDDKKSRVIDLRPEALGDTPEEVRKNLEKARSQLSGFNIFGGK